jgi:phosphopantetheine--protein transferase-like protein
MEKVISCGIDIEELDRFKKFIPTHADIPELTKLIYSDEEIRINRAFQPHITFPLGFSCKESFFKAFGVSWTNSPISWKEIELLFEGSANLQQYNIRLTGYAMELFQRMNCSRFETVLEINEDFVVFQVMFFSK